MEINFDQLKLSFIWEPSPKGEKINDVLDILNIRDWDEIKDGFNDGYVLVEVNSIRTIISGRELLLLKKNKSNGLEKFLDTLDSKGILITEMLNKKPLVLLVRSDVDFILELPWEEIKIDGEIFFQNENRFVLRILAKDTNFERHNKYNFVLLSAYSNDDPYLGNKADISYDIKNELNKIIGSDTGALTQALLNLSDNNGKMAGYYVITHANRDIMLNSSLKNFNIFHFIGHGEADKGLSFESTSENIPIVFRDSDKNPIHVCDWVDDQLITKLTEDSPFTVLIFSACDSARPSHGANNLLLRCLKSGKIEFGIGFQKEISSGLLPDFWNVFYNTFLSITKNCDLSTLDNDKVIESYWLARKIFTTSGKYWNSPVIYKTDSSI